MSTEAESSRNVSVSMGEGPPDEALLRWKAEIVSHPLYEQLLASHVSCLRIATPMDRLHTIDSQLARCQHVVSKYSVFLRNANSPPLLDEQRKELDHFLSQYVLLLCTFKDQLQYHVRVHAMDAVMACFEIEKSFMSLTGISLAEAVGSTVSDDDEDDYMGNDSVPLEGDFDDHGAFGFGPLVPTDNERSLIEKVRQELKQDLKQGYRSKISDVREEILRKRRAGKLPGDTTCRLKEWWQSHAKWPYPTEDEKARLVEETGLQLKQINNWFINQRKRNWHSNPSAAAAVSNTSKRKREV